MFGDSLLATVAGAGLLASTFAMHDRVSGFMENFIGMQGAIIEIAQEGGSAEDMQRQIDFMSSQLPGMEEAVDSYVDSYKDALAAWEEEQDLASN